MNDISLWLVAIFFNKILIYIAFAMSIGGDAATLMIQRYKPGYRPFFVYTVWGVVIGLVASSIDFFLQVGSFSESGLAGMWDPDYVDILWQSGVGMSYKLRLFGWLGLALLLTITYFYASTTKILSALTLAILFIIATSFIWVGHTAEQIIWVKLALVLHVFIAMWWIGSLYPLRFCCIELTPDILQRLMHEFGKQASILVVILILTGIGISYALEGSVMAFFTTKHGNMLLLKLGVVAAILSIAAHHKLRLVPSVVCEKTAYKLQLSINVEMGISLLILIITAALSTLVGPAYT